MKKITFLTAFLFFSSITLYAQITELVNPANGGPTAFSFIGNDLYYTKFSGSIAKIDVTAPTPITPIDVVTGLNDPEGILVVGNYIYFTQSANKISKIDITASTPTIIDVVTGLSEPNGLLLKGNDLYIAEIGGGKLSKIDITAATPTTAVDVITGLNTPLDLALNGNDLYIVEVNANKISKIDITAATPTTTTVVTGLNKPLHIELSGTILYISEADGDKISKIDITASIPTTAITVTNAIESPECLALKNNELYFSSFPDSGPTIIGKYNLAPLSVNNFDLEAIKLYPNPTTDYIQVEGLTEKIDYSVFNILGQEIQKGIISPQIKIDFQNVNNGMYVLKLQGEKIQKDFKIIKE